jgi:hypothetical protein
LRRPQLTFDALDRVFHRWNAQEQAAGMQGYPDAGTALVGLISKSATVYRANGSVRFEHCSSNLVYQPPQNAQEGRYGTYGALAHGCRNGSDIHIC